MPFFGTFFFVGGATGASPERVRRFAPKVIINFDPDNAGQSAAERSSELLVEAGFSKADVRALARSLV